MRGGIQEVLSGLEKAKVRYLVVGGVAVVHHGHLRTTLDLDLVIQLEEENLSRALGIFFEAAYRRALVVRLPKTDATIIGMEDLVRMKLASGRPRDLQDIEVLRRLASAHRDEEER